MCPTKMEEGGPFDVFCLQTSFVIFKIAVNIPLNGTAHCQPTEFSLLKETTQGLRVPSSSVAHYDINITVTVTS